MQQSDTLTAIESRPMSWVQILAVMVCIGLNALDGFDVLAISFASPGISQEWGIDRAALGVVLAMELVGMAIGSITLGSAADKYGRRPTILVCLCLMTMGMTAAIFVQSLSQLLFVRLITGLGIGGMLAATNAMVAEFANKQWRNLCVILMATGYPLGAILGGSFASHLLTMHSWRSVFVLGAIATASFLLVVWVCLPESLNFLLQRQPRNALVRANALLASMKASTLAVLPTQTESSVQQGQFRQLFTPALRPLTLLLMLAYFAQIMTFYFILKWIPKLVVDMGFAPASAGQVLVWANVGGALGAILLSLLASKLPLRRLLMGVMVVAFVMVSIFGMGHHSLPDLAWVSAATGFFTNAAVVGLYALMAQIFPPSVRGSGTGLVIGVGRGGAALSPMLAGWLFSTGAGLQGVAITMGAGALIAAAALRWLGNVSKQDSASAQQGALKAHPKS